MPGESISFNNLTSPLASSWVSIPITKPSEAAISPTSFKRFTTLVRSSGSCSQPAFIPPKGRKATLAFITFIASRHSLTNS